MNKMLKQNAAAIAAALGLLCLTAAGIFIFDRSFKSAAAVHAQEEVKSQPNKSEFGDQPRCTNATLEGKYAVIGSGYVPNANGGAPLVPFGVLTQATMDGKGNLTQKVTTNVNGQITQDVVNKGTYIVNADCTGSMNVTTPNPPFQLSFNLIIAELQGTKGKEFYFISTRPGGLTTNIAKRIQ